jgi:IPT/TIG domain
MRSGAICFVLLMFFSLSAYGAVQITSLSPDSASPGTEVAVTGGPFGAGIRVLIGEAEVTPQTLEGRRLTFVLPDLPPGQYLLRLAEADVVSPHPLLFQVVTPQPQISAISPAEYDQCLTDPPPRIEVTGKGFAGTASLLIDDVAVPVESVTRERITLTAPALSPGPHQIVVANPGGNRSFPRGLLVNGTPEIFSVQIGSDDVTSYELIIDGKNFLAASQLLVDGKHIPLGQNALPGQDSASFSDCRTLVYHRHPYSSQPKRIAIQVFNPGGSQSAVTYIQAP